MNMDNNPTVDELRELVKGCEDRKSAHVPWIAKNGEVHISPLPKEKSPPDFEKDQPDMQVRLETFQAGNEYVGPEAAQDDDWMNQLFSALSKEWPKAKDKASVEYVDHF